MSEAADGQPAADAPIVDASPGAEASAAQAATTETPAEDIDTDAFDRVEVADDEEAEPATGEDGQPLETDAAAAEPEDIEFETDDGQKLKVPKALEPHLLREKDYRQKTMALADERKAVETKASELASQEVTLTESLKSFREEHLAVAQHETVLKSIDEQLAAFAKITPAEWDLLRAQPADENGDKPYDQARDRRQSLRDARSDYEEALKTAKTDLETKEASLATKRSEAETASLNDNWTKANAVLATKIEGWGPEKFKELGTWANKEFGVTAEQLRQSADPVGWLMANRLMKAEAELAVYKKSAKQTKATETALKPQVVTPAVKPAGGGTTATLDPAKPGGDKLSTDQWMKRRFAQKAAAQRR